MHHCKSLFTGLLVSMSNPSSILPQSYIGHIALGWSKSDFWVISRCTLCDTRLCWNPTTWMSLSLFFFFLALLE
jgi:hypothetical protein